MWSEVSDFGGALLRSVNSHHRDFLSSHLHIVMYKIQRVQTVNDVMSYFYKHMQRNNSHKSYRQNILKWRVLI